MTSIPKIAIVGAGPAGLTLARILAQHAIPSVIFESDPSPDHRTQGGSLDLHPETGQAALHTAGLYAQFTKYARGVGSGEDLMTSDKNGSLKMDYRGVDTGRPEIDRTRLKKILLDSVPQGTIRWGWKLRAATRDARTSKVVLDFGSIQEGGFDLVVGADGAWSKIRPLLTPVRPFYSGVGGLEFTLTDPDAKHPEIAKWVGNGSHGAFDNEDGGQALLCQRQENGDIRVYAWGVRLESWIEDNDIDLEKAPQKAKEVVLKDYQDWAPQLRKVIESCSVETMAARNLYMFPVGLQWAAQKDVTLVGDAAHLMTPCAGEGVNAALTDAMDLALAIVENRDDIGKTIQEYESKMFPRARAIMQQTWDLKQIWFEPGCVDGLVQALSSELMKNKVSDTT